MDAVGPKIAANVSARAFEGYANIGGVMKILHRIKMVSEYLLMPFDIIEENLIPVQKLAIRIDRFFKDYLGIILWAVLLLLFSAILFLSCSKDRTSCTCLYEDGTQRPCETLSPQIPYSPPIDIVCY